MCVLCIMRKYHPTIIRLFDFLALRPSPPITIASLPIFFFFSLNFSKPPSFFSLLPLFLSLFFPSPSLFLSLPHLSIHINTPL